MTFSTPSRRVRKVAIVAAIALAGSLTQVALSSAATLPKVTRGGYITVGIPDSFVGYCEGEVLAHTALMGARTIYEPWVEQRADGKIVPYLLKSLTSSADGKIWILTVRDGINFHDGTPLDGAALVLNLQAARGVLTLQGKMRSPGTGGSVTANIVNVELVTPMTVRVTLYQGDSDLKELLYRSGRFVARAPSQILGGTKCSTTPIGTGAFTLVSTKLTELVVKANPDYWRKAPGGGKLPYLAGITFTTLVETQSRVSGVRSGVLDAALFSTGGEAKQIISLQANSSVNTIISPVEEYPTIWLNHKIAPFDSKNARLAFSHALDREKFVKVRQKGMGGVPKSIVGPNSIMYNESGYASFDLAKAKKYVVAYTTETGKALEFSTPYIAGSTESFANATLMKQMAEAAGMKVNLTPFTAAEVVQRSFPQQFQTVTIGVMEGTTAGYILPFLVSDMSGGNPTHVLAKTPLKVLFDIMNLSAFTDTTTDQLLFAARAEPDLIKKTALYKQATRRLQAEARVTNLVYTQRAVVYNKNLKGIGELGLVAGGLPRLITNVGIDLTGVWLQK